MCSHGWLGTQYIDQGVLLLLEIHLLVPPSAEIEGVHFHMCMFSLLLLLHILFPKTLNSVTLFLRMTPRVFVNGIYLCKSLLQGPEPYFIVAIAHQYLK